MRDLSKQASSLGSSGNLMRTQEVAEVRQPCKRTPSWRLSVRGRPPGMNAYNNDENGEDTELPTQQALCSCTSRSKVEDCRGQKA